MNVFNSPENESISTDFDFHCGPELNENRRLAPRHRVNLRASILITAVKTLPSSAETYFVLQGQLLDVSISGLAIIISSDDLRELQRLGNNIKLLLMLPLPAQSIELEATPVRYQLFDKSDSGIILGAQILDMSGRDRIVFMNFINHCDSLKNDRVIHSMPDTTSVLTSTVISN